VLEVAHVGEGSYLMDDRIRLVSEDGPDDGWAVQQVELDGLRAESGDSLSAPGRPMRPDYLVAALDQLGDQPAADGATRACDEDSHRFLLVTSVAFQGSALMTRELRRM
jgi:hypothetical protein